MDENSQLMVKHRIIKAKQGQIWPAKLAIFYSGGFLQNFDSSVRWQTILKYLVWNSWGHVQPV